MFKQNLSGTSPDLHSKINFDLPFTLSIGPQRCATSWMDRYLRQRGDICLPSKVKEIRYFDTHYAQGSEFYRRHFLPASNHSGIMEISTTSFDDPQAPQRVFNTLGPDIKLLCPLRHPVSRSYSLYQHYMRYGQVNGSLQEACEKLPQILSSSYYERHLQSWLTYFPLEQIKFTYQEDLETDQIAYIKDLCCYLNISYRPPNDETQSRFNSTVNAKYSILAASIQSSAEFLRKHELYDLINAAKSVGLKSLVFGRDSAPNNENAIPESEKAWLEERLIQEVERLESLIGPIPQW